MLELKKVLESKDWATLKRHCDDKVASVYESVVESKKDEYLLVLKNESAKEAIDDENDEADDDDKDPGDKKIPKGKKPFQPKEVGDSDEDKKKVGYDG